MKINYLNIGMQANWDEYVVIQAEFFSHANSRWKGSLRWDVPPWWDVSPHVNIP